MTHIYGLHVRQKFYHLQSFEYFLDFFEIECDLAKMHEV